MVFVYGFDGCVSPVPGGDLADVRLVSRSKQESPAWIKADPGTLIAAGTDWQMVTCREKILNLPLGLKQTQLVAIEQMAQVLANSLRDQLLERAPAKASASVKDASDLARLSRNAVDQAFGSEIKIADLYFETFANNSLAKNEPMAEYHSVFALTKAPSRGLAKAAEALARRLEKSSKPELRDLAPEALALANSLHPKP